MWESLYQFLTLFIICGACSTDSVVCDQMNWTAYSRPNKGSYNVINFNIVVADHLVPDITAHGSVGQTFGNESVSYGASQVWVPASARYFLSLPFTLNIFNSLAFLTISSSHKPLTHGDGQNYDKRGRQLIQISHSLYLPKTMT